MILVDSCVWIDLLRGHETSAVKSLLKIQKDQAPEICISSIIYFEVLRGIRSDLERKRVQKSFDLLERRDYTNHSFSKLIALYRQTQKEGITLSKLGDWLVFKTVLDHSLELLTSDRDFIRLHKVVLFWLYQAPDDN